MSDTFMQISLSLVAFDKMSRVIKDAVQKSNAEFDKMQKKIKATSDMMDKLGKDMMKTGAILSTAGLGVAYKLGMTDTINEALDLEHRLRELGNVGQLTNNQLKEMDKRLGSISRSTNQFRGEIVEGLNVLVASGIDPEKALDYMEVIGRTATAAQAEIVDISKTAFSLTDNLKVNVNDLGKTMDMLAQAGKEGRFELKDMASAFPSLTAGASMLGMKGVPAVAQLGAALQIAMKGAGSASEAANNFENFIQKVTSPLAVKNFEEVFGLNLKNILINAANEGKDPILEVIEIMKQASGGDVFKISEVFQDKQVLNFIKPMLQNLDEYKRIKESALSADGIMESDFNNMLGTTNEQIKLLKINLKELVFPHLSKPIELINSLLIKINSNPLLQKGLFTAIMGSIGVGVLLTTLGAVITLGGKLVGVYGNLLVKARELAPILASGFTSLLNNTGFVSSAHSFETVFNMFKSGNKLGLNLPRHFLLGMGADIRRIDNNLKQGLINSFKSLPSNILKATTSLKEWSITSLKAIPNNIISGLTAFKNGFLAIPSIIRTAIVAFRAFSLTLLTSPLGWIALAIAGVAFVIYKYWKPISVFFKGLWQGLKEGLQPLMPLFNRIGNALQPLFLPIKTLINWFKNIIKPVEDTGGAVEKMGVKFGKAISNIIVKIVELITKVFEFGKRISEMIANGILSGVGKIKNAISTVTQTIRDFLPHSPAKTGPLKDLNKIKIIETIAATLKPLPLMSAMNKSLSFFTNKMSTGLKNYALSSSAPIVINYSPTITMSGNQSKEEFITLLKRHKDEIVSIIRKERERQERLAY